MRGCQMKLGRMGTTRGTEIWRVLNTKSKSKDLWQSQQNLWWSIFMRANNHCKTSLQIVSLFSVFILTCLQVLPQSEVMYISSLYSTSWDPRLPEEKMHTEYLHMNTERESLIFFFLTWGKAAISSLCSILREGGVSVSELHLKRVKLWENWRLQGIKGWELVRAEHFTERVHNNSNRKLDFEGDSVLSLCSVCTHTFTWWKLAAMCW